MMTQDLNLILDLARESLANSCGMEIIMTDRKVKDMTQIAMMVVIITICSWISIPLTVPITMQTFAVFFAVKVLGGCKGTCAILIHILLGMVGVPVFAGFKAGLGHIVGPTGGYLLGFIIAGLFFWLMKKIVKKPKLDIVWMIIGLLLCYAFGTVWFSIAFAGSKGLGEILMLCVVPFVIPDVIKLVAADVLGGRIARII